MLGISCVPPLISCAYLRKRDSCKADTSNVHVYENKCTTKCANPLKNCVGLQFVSLVGLTDPWKFDNTNYPQGKDMGWGWRLARWTRVSCNQIQQLNSCGSVEGSKLIWEFSYAYPASEFENASHVALTNSYVGYIISYLRLDIFYVLYVYLLLCWA